MTKHYPREYRLEWLRMMRIVVELHPKNCMVCRQPTDERHELILMDFVGGDARHGEDGRITGPICRLCTSKVLSATQAVLTGKALRS